MRRVESVSRLLPALLAALFLAACVPAKPPPPRTAHTLVVQCLAQFEALDAEIAARGVTPSSPQRIHGFPYLRTDRFLASFRQEPLSDEQFTTWWLHLVAADREARRIEQASLSANRVPAFTELEPCYAVMEIHDRNHPQRRALIQANAELPDEYLTAAQVVGLYPITRWAVQAGIAQYQTRQHQRFAVPLEELPVQGELRRFRPQEGSGLAEFHSEVDPLGIPVLGKDEIEALFAHHAPVWEIDVVDDYDLPGQPVRHADGTPGVDAREPLTYRYVSYTRWQSRPVLQLNYLVWFDRRPRVGMLDILGGPLDGVLWRVTLDRYGRPLLYDSIHPCGCYHLLFPTDRVKQNPASRQLPEPPLIPQRVAVPETGERLVVRLESGSHYIQRVYADHLHSGRPSGKTYSWRDYAALYATPSADGGSDTLFRSDGIIAGTERAERSLLWPMGIPEPGAMRERGRHAIAFLGRSHFDDPDLLDRFFRPVE